MLLLPFGNAGQVRPHQFVLPHQCPVSPPALSAAGHEQLCMGSTAYKLCKLMTQQ